jgi:hypothetical protein
MADNLFDNVQEAAFDIVTTTMGYDATWTPSGGGPEKTGRVLLNNPTESRKIAEVEYNPYEYYMEYKRGIFDGLKEAADANADEVVTIKNVEYDVLEVAAKFDGNTLIAKVKIKD